ncbi:MAG: sugar phosphate isomerase/epimerase [Candidatus Heimdallarchaeota archaeon]|nr:sugar phosphate isomerase/epimerase [Candidatus Heimdallarchaeota archaeon]
MTLEPFRGMSVKQVVPLLRLLDLDHFEINMTMIPKIDEFVKSIHKKTATFHLPIYNRFHYDIGSQNPNYQGKIKQLIDFLNYNKERLNLKYVLTHPPEDSSSTNLSIIERLEQINVPILIENILGQSDENFMEFYFQAKDRLGRKLAGHALDISHRYVNDWQSWLAVPEELVKDIAYVHISDCTKYADLHLPLGLGELPYEEFFSYLKNIGFRGIFLQEVIPTVNQLSSLLDSFLVNVKPFSVNRYRKLKILYGLTKPMLNLAVNTSFKELRKSGHGLNPQDLGFDLATH